MRNKLKTIAYFLKKNSKLTFALFFVVLVVFFAGRTLFNNQLARTDDLELHAIRVANYYLAIKQGQFPPYWGPNLYHGFGYPVFLFSYHTPYLISVIFYMIGLSIERSLNLFLLFTLFIGAIGAFIFSYQKNKKYILAVITSLLYLSSPYILLNYFVRGSVGEIAFISLLPWVFWLISVRGQVKKWWYKLIAVLVFTSLLLSHLLSLLILVPIVFCYLLIIGLKKIPLEFYLAGISAVLLSAFNWLPIILEKKFTIAATHSINQNFANRFPDFISLFYSQWGYGGADSSIAHDVLPTTLGFSVLLIIIISIWQIIKSNKRKQLKLEIFWVGVFIVSLFLMTPISKSIWSVSKVLPYLQYPWRFLWVGTLSAIMLLNLKTFIKNQNNKTKKIVFIFIFLGAVFNLTKFAKPLSYISNSDYEWRQHPSTSTSDNELKPIWFDEEKNLVLDQQIALRNNSGEIIEIAPQNLIWTGSKMTYQINTDQNLEVLQKTVYFPGWEARVNGKKVPINYQDEEFSGRIIFPITKGKNQIEVKLTNNTFAKKSGLILSILGFSLWIGLLIVKKEKK